MCGGVRGYKNEISMLRPAYLGEGRGVVLE